MSDEKMMLFGMSHALIERELDKIEQALCIDLKRGVEDDKDEVYYPQFAQSLRTEAAAMARHYELFYCLEKSIRNIVAETLKAAHGDAWWKTCAPQAVRDNASKNMQREIDSGVTIRSEQDIDFTNFGELGEIVRQNWKDFDSMFASEKAFTKIMTSLNMLRGPIAHCCPLAEDETVRLRLTVRDWYRLME